MSARRQASTTSLSKYARAGTPDLQNRSLDFCNAFWGLGDGGVDVLFARMRGATRTMEELRSFWKERASIEEQYSKRLAALAKLVLGRDEIGELRASLDTLKMETDKQAQSHAAVAQAIKADLEGSTANFLTKQQQHKRTVQAAVEKEFKTKQTQESYVSRAREKYEQDCMRINSYTAQSTLIQGRDLEKVHTKLERAQQTVQANQRDYTNFARALQETTHKWEQTWKNFCDSCQDLEEERIEFMKDNMWAYANAVSTVCVSDDESCEKLRLTLEQLEPERDMENFVRDYGTGNGIPDPPPFIDYSSPDAQPAASQRPTTHIANFSRQTGRPRQSMPPQQQQEPEEEPRDMTGVGSRGADAESQRAQSRASTRTGGEPNGTNGRGSSMGVRAPDPNAEQIGFNSTTMLKVGSNTYEVNLDRDPQAHPGPGPNGSMITPRVGQDDDPLQRQLNELRSADKGSVRRSGTFKPPMQQQSQPGGSQRRDPGAKLSPPPGASVGGGPPSRNYRHSAEFVVGAYPPGAIPSSRPASPNPTTNVHMLPPSQQGAPSSAIVSQVIDNYGQSLPGERKSMSRRNSRSNSISGPQGSSIRDRPHSGESGHAGIGAQGRSVSPQPFQSVSRSASPANRGSVSRNGQHPGHAHTGSTASRAGSISIPPQPAHQQRSTSPGIGIALDPSGRVTVDEMARSYQQPPAQQQPQQQFRQPYQQPPPAQPAVQQPIQRRPSYSVANGAAPAAQQYPGAAPAAPGYGQPPVQYAPPPVQQQQQQQQQQAYGAPAYGQQQGYQQPQQPHPGYAAPQAPGSVVPSGVARGQSTNGYYPQGGYQQPPQQPQQQPYRAPSPRAPSPQPAAAAPPTGQYTEDGRGVLFYVKAMYNYRATIEEEFDFQEGDIIAVTATPEDGWWSGELLDEARRQPGRHVFPSNFVCLF